MEIYREIHQRVNYFKDKKPEFITEIAPLLAEANIEENQYVYQEG